MKRIWLIIFLIVNASISWAGNAGDNKLINWMRNDISIDTGMPFSYQPMGVKKDVFAKIGGAFSTTGIIERTIVNEGISIYDASLWQIVLSQTGNRHDLAMARQPVDYYWTGSLDEFYDIRTGSDNQIFVYDPNNPHAVSSDLTKKGSRGFIFRILNATGHYLSLDPLDGKARYIDYPNDPRIHWEDWKPIAGENAWVVLAAMHLLEHKPQKEWATSEELNLSEELARAAMYLQAENGGVRMAPLGTYFHLWDINAVSSDVKITSALDSQAMRFKNGLVVPDKELRRFGNVSYPPQHTWYYQEISTENNISWYAAFRMLYRVTGDTKYLNAMNRIEKYFKSVWDAKDKVFYQGAHFTNGAWIPNLSPFASDVQNWSIDVLGPAKIDEWFGEGSAYQIWRSTKFYSGVYDTYGLEGIGFTKEKDRISVEWTAGAILANRRLSAYYAKTHPDWSKETRNDALTMRIGVDDYYFTPALNQGAYSYSSVREWIPFGWFSNSVDILSLASTSWIVLIDKGLNPFDLW